MCDKVFVFFSDFRWFCHFDDDNYVNVHKLVDLLKDYSPSVDWYLGKPSIASPLEIFIDNVSFKFIFDLLLQSVELFNNHLGNAKFMLIVYVTED